MKSCIVTGSRSFLGSRVTAELKRQGYWVIQSELFSDIEFLPKLAAQTLIHCEETYDWVDVEVDVMRTNVEGTAWALKLAKNWQVSQFIHLSSASVAGAGPSEWRAEGIVDDHHGGFALCNNAFEVSKRQSEQLVRSSGLDYLIVRPTHLLHQKPFELGPVEPHTFLHKMIQGLLELSMAGCSNQVRINGYHDSLLDFVDVQRVAEFMVAAVVRAEGDQAFVDQEWKRAVHLASGAGFFFDEVLRILSERFDGIEFQWDDQITDLAGMENLEGYYGQRQKYFPSECASLLAGESKFVESLSKVDLREAVQLLISEALGKPSEFERALVG